jgi:hypothetical protein
MRMLIVDVEAAQLFLEMGWFSLIEDGRGRHGLQSSIAVINGGSLCVRTWLDFIGIRGRKRTNDVGTRGVSNSRCKFRRCCGRLGLDEE